jgi:hypothetical protein
MGATLLECARLKTLLEQSAAELLAQREANSEIRLENISLKQRIKEFERLNSKQERKMLKLKETAARVKGFSLQLSLIEKDIENTQATLDADAGHALSLLKELRLSIQKHCSSDKDLCTMPLTSLCACIDQVSRALARMCSYFPAQSSSEARDQTGAASLLFKHEDLASSERNKLLKLNSDLGVTLSARAHEANQTQVYIKALESRICFLEAEMVPLRSRWCPIAGQNTHAFQSRSFSASGDNGRRKQTSTKPLQGAFSKTLFIPMLLQTHTSVQLLNRSFPTSSRTHMPFRLCRRGDCHISRDPRRPGRRSIS